MKLIRWVWGQDHGGEIPRLFSNFVSLLKACCHFSGSQDNNNKLHDIWSDLACFLSNYETFLFLIRKLFKLETFLATLFNTRLLSDSRGVRPSENIWANLETIWAIWILIWILEGKWGKLQAWFLINIANINFLSPSLNFYIFKFSHKLFCWWPRQVWRKHKSWFWHSISKYFNHSINISDKGSSHFNCFRKIMDYSLITL